MQTQSSPRSRTPWVLTGVIVSLAACIEPATRSGASDAVSTPQDAATRDGDTPRVDASGDARAPDVPDVPDVPEVPDVLDLAGLADAAPADAAQRPTDALRADATLRPADAAPGDARPGADAQPADAQSPVPDVAVMAGADTAIAPTPDAAPPTPDAAPPTPDASPPTPDAAQPTPDAAPPTPDAAPPTPDAAPPPDPDAGVCPPSPPCGLNGRGVFPGHCEAGAFVVDGRCRDPDGCVDGDAFEQACGADFRGVETWRCVHGAWGPDGPCVDAVCSLTLPAGEGHTAGPVARQAFDRGSCGGDGVEQPFRFTAPRASHFAFRAADVAFDTAVYLRSTCAEPATELACAAGGNGVPGQVVWPLAAGASVDVLVDALHGDVGALGLQITDACSAPLALRSPDVNLVPSGTEADLAIGGARVAAVSHVVFAPARDEVQVAILDLDGRTISAAAPLSPHEAVRARVAWNGARFGAVWLDEGRGTRSLYYTSITPQGAIGAEARLTQIAQNPNARTFDLSWDAVAGAYWLVWTEATRDELRALRFTADGVVVAGPFVLDTGVDPDLEPAVVPDGGGIAVSFGDRDGANAWSAFARYDAAGVRRGAVHRLNVVAEGSLQHGLARAGQTWAVAFEDRIGGVRHVMLQRFDAAGVSQGARLQLTSARDGGSRPRLAVANGEFGVIYLEIRGAVQPAPQLVFQAVGVDGRKRGPAVPLTERVTERDHLRLVSFGREYGLTYWESGLRRAFYSRGTLGCPP